MVPPRPPAHATGSEIEVFRLLESVEAFPEAVCFSSLNLSDHEYKKWAEVDFVILAPHGLLALEVKGGSVYCDRGIWRYEGRGRQPIERFESPMAQVSSAYFALRDRVLVPKLGKAVSRKAASGFGVILARTTSKEAEARGLIGGSEMVRELVATRDDLGSPDDLGDWIASALAYWRSKDGGESWRESELRELACALRPWFDRVPPLSLSAAKVRDEQLALSEEQYAILDFCQSADRVLCTGGAGCGKTLLAVEALRREAGKRPLLVTGTDALALHLRAASTADASCVWSFSELSRLDASRRPTAATLIVDEGQQLTNASSVDLLSSILQGGIANGRWRWFSDPNHQVDGSAGFDPGVHARLAQSAFCGRLTKNCRNTPPIVGAVQLLTGADLGTSKLRGSGPDVVFASSPKRDEQLKAAAATIKSWLSDPELAPGDIVLLSPGPVQSSSIPEICRLIAVPYRPWRPGWALSPEHRTAVAASNVHDFRGLEAPFVVLCDMTLSTPDAKTNMYIGMTRANFGLFVMAEHELVQHLAMDATSPLRRSPE